MVLKKVSAILCTAVCLFTQSSLICSLDNIVSAEEYFSENITEEAELNDTDPSDNTEYIGELAYIRDSDHIVITGFSNKTASVTIPSEIEGIPVTEIGENAFADCTLLEEIYVPDSVSVIGEFAFSNCTNLSCVRLPDSIKELDYKVFYNTSSLNSIDGADDLEIILTSCTFTGNLLDTAQGTVPDIVTKMYSDSYWWYRSISIGKNLKEFIFADANDPDVVWAQGYKNIDIDDENPYLCSENGLILNKDKTELFYKVPCYDSEGRISVIPATVNKISCAYIADSINIEDGNTSFKVVDGVLFDYEMKTLLAYPQGSKDYKYTIPYGVETISELAFYGSDCKYLIIPRSVNKIEKGAFWLAFFEFIAFDHLPGDDISFHKLFAGYYTQSMFFYDGANTYYAYDGSVPALQFPDDTISRNHETEGVCGENLTWKYDNFKLYISGFGEMTKCSENGYPWSDVPVIDVKFEGKGIKIAENAFLEHTDLHTADLSGVTEIGISAFMSCKNLISVTNADNVNMVSPFALYGTKWERQKNNDAGMNILGSVLVRYVGDSDVVAIPENITYVSGEAFSEDNCKTIYVPEKDIVYSELAFSNNTSIEHVRFIGSDQDITVEEMKKAAESCTEVTLSDEYGNVYTGIGYRSDNTLMNLVNSISNTPFANNLCNEYCENILKSNNCSSDMTDLQLINVIYGFINRNVEYGYIYEEDPFGTLTDENNNKWSLSANMTHDAFGIVVLGKGVCSAYADVVSNYVDRIQKNGFSNTLKCEINTGLNHEWNVIGIDTGTEKEKWYYLDLSNGTYLIGYENPILSSNSQMFSYDPGISRNDDGTYTIKIHNGTKIRLQGSDLSFQIIKGDINHDGKVSIDDAASILSIYAVTVSGLQNTDFSPEQFAEADVNEDGKVTIADAAAVLSYYAQQSSGITPDWTDIIK